MRERERKREREREATCYSKLLVVATYCNKLLKKLLKAQLLLKVR